jgi:hypothetical protein
MTKVKIVKNERDPPLFTGTLVHVNNLVWPKCGLYGNEQQLGQNNFIFHKY